MARQRVPDRLASLGEPADEIRITFLPDPAGPGRSSRMLASVVRVMRPLWLVLGVAAALAGAGLLVSTARTGLDASAGGARAPGPAGVAAAYRYPRACLSVTISSADRSYAAARLDRVSPCWRYGVYVTALFRRVDGVWRALPASGEDQCPRATLPAVVQEQLGVCPKRDFPAVRVPPLAPIP